MALTIANSGGTSAPTIAGGPYSLGGFVGDLVAVVGALDLSAISSASTFELFAQAQINYLSTNWSTVWRSGMITPDTAALTGIVSPPLPAGQAVAFYFNVGGVDATGVVNWAVYKL